MASLYNLARVSTATTGTGTITLGSAISGFLTFALAGVSNGETVAYGISDGANSEVGTGVYTTAGTTLTRSVTTSTNSNAAINLSGTAQVYILARAQDLLNPANNLSDVASAATARANLSAIKQTLDTPQATTSGASKDFTIPTGCKSFTVAWHDVSASGTGIVFIQLGDAGGVEATGYAGADNQVFNSGATTGINGTTALFIQPAATAANVIHGAARFTLVNSSTNTWVGTGASGNSDAAANQIFAYSKSLSQELTTVRFGVSSGSFDAGEVNVLYESP